MVVFFFHFNITGVFIRRIHVQKHSNYVLLNIKYNSLPTPHYSLQHEITVQHKTCQNIWV